MQIGIKGLLFDCASTTWVMLPVWLSLLVGKERWAYRVWVLSSGLALAVEVIDIGYFPYTHRRSGPELFYMLGFWQDFLPAFGKYFRDFLAGFVFWGILVGGLIVIGRKIRQLPQVTGRLRLIGWGITGVGVAIGFRGGIKLKPLSVVDAALPGCPPCTPFVLNTTFSLVRALEQPPLPPWPDPPPEPPPYPRRWESQGKAFAYRHNVVLIVLESFSAEYVERGYAPFLASLLKKGTSVRWGFATNSRSAEGIPAILSGLPSWGEEPLVFTPYASQIRHSLGDLLKQWGYSTVFFHGGNNGTMLLDSYARQAGFQSYIGRQEYPYPQRDYDGTWGIWDEPFLRFCAQQLSQLPEPFCGVIFTLSSHHPYAVPPALRDSFPKGKLPIHASIRYADWALSRFFAAVETTSWAQRTLFVLTADHTGPSELPFEATRAFQVPIAFYMPGRQLPPCDSLASHIDILPSILEAIGYPYPVPVWGKSVWAPCPQKWAPQKVLPLLFQVIGKDAIVLYQPTASPKAYHWQEAPWNKVDADTLPVWYEDWLAYLAGYGAWIEGRSQVPPKGPQKELLHDCTAGKVSDTP